MDSKIKSIKQYFANNILFHTFGQEMRGIIFIWAIFLLGLGMTPCSDTVDLHKHDTHQAEQQGHSHDKDACTPFCTCSCCSTVVVVKNFFYKITTPLPSRTVEISFFNKFHSKLVPNPIWHPPVS